MDLTQVIGGAEIALALEPEELGGVIIELAQTPEDGRLRERFHPQEINQRLAQRTSDAWPRAQRDEVMLAICEALAWLETMGLIIPDPSQISGGGTQFRILTRRGRLLKTRANVAAYRDAGILPLGLVHPVISEKVHAMFLRGDHDVAVFQAFKAVEVAVRAAAGLPNELGVTLMRSAFHKETDPLRDQALPGPEREAEMHLFAGAIGYAKNPGSHREVEMGRPEAARLILLASQLLFQVDKRGSARN
ncbi:TIGR02391 family protein [Roseomonas sp. CAU 1739]|uniref:TIGR02391 family protein n=1 Tax=Roseomonas sp. CAU 1739 TaxID=3140364 RepID=UPI00325A588B